MKNEITQFLYAAISDAQGTIRATDSKIGLLLVMLAIPFTKLGTIYVKCITLLNAESRCLGAMSFPEAVGKLIAAGVEYYQVDYVRLRKTCYSAEGKSVTTPIAFNGLPPVAPDLDVVALRANILDSQHANQPYREFTRRAMASGVQGYIAFLRGKRVLYFGRNGEQHVEWFPGAKP